MTTTFPIEGGCDCGTIRYLMTTKPLIVHCCHCRWCQRETGSAFVLNAAIESDRVENLGDSPVIIDTPSDSGMGQKVARCPKCYVALWSHYAGSGGLTKYVRVGTLDQPDLIPPDVHIFTSSKQPWVVIPDSMMSFEEYYDLRQVWRRESLDRLTILKPKIDAYRNSLNKES
ncbi:MAG: GFA family protein [Chloroflexota bacterium]